MSRTESKHVPVVTELRALHSRTTDTCGSVGLPCPALFGTATKRMFLINISSNETIGLVDKALICMETGPEIWVSHLIKIFHSDTILLHTAASYLSERASCVLALLHIHTLCNMHYVLQRKHEEHVQGIR